MYILFTASFREEDKQRAEEEQFSKRREALDLINDPVLKRLKEKNRSGTKYSKAPDSRPFAVCFDLVGPSVAHSTVKFKLDQLFEQLNDTDVKVTVLEMSCTLAEAVETHPTALSSNWASSSSSSVLETCCGLT